MEASGIALARLPGKDLCAHAQRCEKKSAGLAVCQEEIFPTGSLAQKQSGREADSPIPRERDSARQHLQLPTEAARGTWRRGPHRVGMEKPLQELSGLSFPIQEPSGMSSPRSPSKKHVRGHSRSVHTTHLHPGPPGLSLDTPPSPRICELGHAQ